MTKPRFDFLAAALAFAAPLGLYLAYPSTMWNFDGVACAIAMELGDPVYYFHGNHLIFGALGRLFWEILKPIGFSRALPALQLLTSLFSAAGLLGLFFLAKSMTRSSAVSLLITWFVAVSAVYWVWSVEAQVYTLAFAGLAWATWALFQAGLKRRGLWIGALHGIAILGHVVNVLWVIPAAAVILQTHKNKADLRRVAIEYVLAATLTVSVPYVLVFAFVMWPAHPDWDWARQWIFGSAALNQEKSFQWHYSGPQGIFIWLKTSAKVFWGTFWPYGAARPGAVDWILTAASLGIFLKAAAHVWKNRAHPAVRGAVVWLAVYGLFFSSWEPSTECYRLFDFVPWALLLAAAFSDVKRPGLLGALFGAAIVGLLVLNLRMRIHPMTSEMDNKDFREFAQIINSTPPESVYVTAGGKRWIYILYFSGRLAYDAQGVMRRPVEFEAFLKNRSALGPVYFHNDALAVEGVSKLPVLQKMAAFPDCEGWNELLR